MNHESHILYRDLVIGSYFSQLSVHFNKVAYLGFSLFFAYLEWKSWYGKFDGLGVAVLSVITLRYFLLIQIFVFLFAAAMAVLGSFSKKGVLGTHKFEFGDHEFSESTDYNKSIHKYEAISKVFTRFGSVYIAMPGMYWHILPKRDFDSVSERDKLVSLIRERCNA